ncbi:hypothetical protein CTAM01_16999 [Colletotrichum tamarilloi]|uniref:Uncharacterized protein n=1 Tax=Colletotrichum tamarilloi TaxID=1209934 RepID=A0ABQ9QGX3_9PEZI|nr:uncharacterized protein CTAM01_16999 [Colletotrichum tamarilloi]KAK1466690.1 hypothetical protein CTAM01_16999 [Colletotrichum tamarilloi]
MTSQDFPGAAGLDGPTPVVRKPGQRRGRNLVPASGHPLPGGTPRDERIWIRVQHPSRRAAASGRSDTAALACLPRSISEGESTTALTMGYCDAQRHLDVLSSWPLEENPSFYQRRRFRNTILQTQRYPDEGPTFQAQLPCGDEAAAVDVDMRSIDRCA